ncbi:PadR family transcriptional regulator [Leptolyngbyaceae cyanobacterium CCMR0082]|uniref:PadR family transcriptional regulator n=2 Tax=Adonisia TaxID=2950183 RepID=A0A6M0S525_9CYAN|nr:PadR family transcriptional regulator [Adonisia turfae CCMR0082]
MALCHTLLVLLIQKARSGYDIGKELKKKENCYWKATQQQVYRELAKMEIKGWVTFHKIPQIGKPDKKKYRITNQGWDELLRWYAVPTKPQPVREDLLVKVLIGYKIPKSLLVEQLHLQQALHQLKLTEYLEIQKYFHTSDLSEELQFKYFTLKYNISEEEAWLAWFDEVLKIVSNS